VALEAWGLVLLVGIGRGVPDSREIIIAAGAFVVSLVPHRVFLIVSLMIFLGGIKILVWEKLYRERLIEFTACGKVFQRGLGEPFLFLVMEVNCRLVLSPAVVKLSACVGRIDVVKEYLEQKFVFYFLRIILNLDAFPVSRKAGRDFYIGRVRFVAAGVADDRARNTRIDTEDRLHAPETAAGKSGKRRVRIFIRHAYALCGIQDRKILEAREWRL